MIKDKIVLVDVMGFNFYPRTLVEVIKDYNLTEKETKALEETGEIFLFGGEVVLTLL